MASRYPLDRELPSDVALGGDSIAAFYQRFPIFSFSWVWRRALLFTPFAVIPAMFAALAHGLMVEDVHEAITRGLLVFAAYASAVCLGPLTAAVVRRAKLAERAEQRLVHIVVITGVVIAMIAMMLADRHHAARMAAYGFPIHGSPAIQDGLEVAVRWLYFYIAGAGLALRSYRTEGERLRKYQRVEELETVRRQRDAADMQLTVLQAQVEPHFLFNTLASIRSLVASDPRRAADTIDALSEHLRATLPRLRADTGVALSTLGEQFSICDSYLRVMRVRMGDRLRTAVILPDELRDLPFPPLMLISLVENAIKHGVEPKVGDVEVRLEASLQAGAVEVTVSDDGAGLTLGMGQGTGFANIRAQLLNRFEDAASLDLVARESCGVVATLRIPMERLTA
jgi:hypothetical protein